MDNSRNLPVKLDFRLLRQIQTRTGLFAIVVISGLGAGVLVIGSAWQISQVVGRAFLNDENLTGLLTPLLLLMSFIFGRAFFNFLGEYSAGILANRIKTGIRKALNEKLLRLGPARAGTEQTGELVAVVTDGVEALDTYFRQYLPQMVLALGIPITMLTVVFPLDFLTGIILLLTAPLIPMFMILIGKASEKATQRQWLLLSRLSAHFLDAIQGLKTLQIFSQTGRERKKLEKNIENYTSVTMDVLKIAFLSALVLELVATLSTAVVAVQIGLRLLYGWLDFYQAFFILLLTPEYYFPLRQFGARFHAGMAGVHAANRIYEILEYPEPMRDFPECVEGTGISDYNNVDRLEISFRKVSYQYQDRSLPAVEDISFDMKPGRITALAGESGSGKSTLAHLLLRFMDPSDGKICCNGRDIRMWNLDLWRSFCSWVPHHPYMFNDTIAANITMGKTDASLAEIRSAASLAELDDYVMALPGRYDTRVGELGGRLSAGQAQRLGLARAFLKNSPLVILDEPISQVDPLLEQLLQNTLQKLCQDRTILIIAHRLLTIRQADKVIVLHRGRLVEQGDLTSLQGKGDWYHELKKDLDKTND